MLANGVVYPFHNVGQGTHRFRFLNACNARLLDLSFVQEKIQERDWSGEPILSNSGKPVAANVDVWQIGTEGGFLPAPVPLVLAGVPVQPFILGPAERADILVTFKARGQRHPLQRRGVAVPRRRADLRLVPREQECAGADHSQVTAPTPARSCGSR